jgi:hypothetical protein
MLPLGSESRVGAGNLKTLLMEWAVGQEDVREEGQMNQYNGEENWRDGNPETFFG